MKKLIVTTGLLFALSFSPVLAETQTLTKADVETLGPQLSNLFSAVGDFVISSQTQIRMQNDLLSGYMDVLRDFSLRLSGTSLPSQVELDSMGKIISGIQTQVTPIVSWRSNFKIVTANISQTLGNIGTILASVQ